MRIAALALLAGSLVLSACDDVDENFVIPFTRTGTYTLQTANGQALPAVVLDQPPLLIEALSGEITVNSDNTFSETGVFRQTDNGVVTTTTVSCTGTYTFSGNTFTFTEIDDGNLCGDTYTGTLSGRTLTATIRNVVGVFQK